jgi:hypothetical protein
MSEPAPCPGVTPPVQAYPIEPLGHPATALLALHGSAGLTGGVLQQYPVFPLPWSAPCPHASIALLCVGVTLPVQRYPVAGAVHDTLEAAAHMGVLAPASGLALGVEFGSQQYWLPPFAATPAPQRRPGFTWSGRSALVHEKPIDAPEHPVTDVSCLHVPEEAT